MIDRITARERMLRELSTALWSPMVIKKLLLELKPDAFYSAKSDELVEIVAEVCGVSPENIMSRSRHTEYAHARFLIFRTLRRMGYSYNQIAQKFNKNHATIIHGCNTIETLLSINDSSTKYKVEELEKRLEKVQLIK